MSYSPTKQPRDIDRQATRAHKTKHVNRFDRIAPRVLELFDWFAQKFLNFLCLWIDQWSFLPGLLIDLFKNSNAILELMYLGGPG